MRDIEERLGVALVPGGSHPGMGTRNALLRIGTRAYLEVVGPDPEQPRPPGGFWFAHGAAPIPALVTWAVRSDNLHGRATGPGGHLLGPVRSMSRTTPDGVRLHWSLTMPRDPLPRGGIIPFFIDWGGTAHPCDGLPDSGVRLVHLGARHPDPVSVRTELAALGTKLEVATGEAQLEAVLETREGAAVTL